MDLPISQSSRVSDADLLSRRRTAWSLKTHPNGLPSQVHVPEFDRHSVRYYSRKRRWQYIIMPPPFQTTSDTFALPCPDPWTMLILLHDPRVPRSRQDMRPLLVSTLSIALHMALFLAAADGSVRYSSSVGLPSGGERNGSYLSYTSG